METGVSFDDCEADAFRFFAHNGLVVDCVISLIQIPRKVLATLVGQRPGKDLGELQTGMSMGRQMESSPTLEQHHFGVGAPGNPDLAPMEAWREPPPGANLAVEHGTREFDTQSRVLP